ncbi:hypothetical protein WICMUC_001849 [Wickerhamomyces mucosus]|uniref:Uncharacterized protein n=1 Tax=Wickerhamomyces mucosus TaxID=1378264 RepID=A0A9P8PTE6_9ASCO|nr:hypothetical protein WICMUC_001849 [Wickerhamomyces mucosus]
MVNFFNGIKGGNKYCKDFGISSFNLPVNKSAKLTSSNDVNFVKTSPRNFEASIPIVLPEKSNFLMVEVEALVTNSSKYGLISSYESNLIDLLAIE